MKIRRIFRGFFHFASYIITKIFYKNDYAYENVKNIIIFRPDNLGDFIIIHIFIRFIPFYSIFYQKYSKILIALILKKNHFTLDKYY